MRGRSGGLSPPGTVSDPVPAVCAFRVSLQSVPEENAVVQWCLLAGVMPCRDGGDRDFGKKTRSRWASLPLQRFCSDTL
jgi:hypothetical protein